MINQMAIIVKGKKGQAFMPVANKDAADALVSLYEKMGNGNCEIKIVKNGKVDFEDLPQEVQDEVIDTLTVFNECYVTYEDGRFKAMAACGIKSSYGWDRFTCNTYYANKVDQYIKAQCC